MSTPTPEQHAETAMQLHFGYPPLRGDWIEVDDEGRPGLARCITAAIREAVAAERETCARICEDLTMPGCADEIRARGTP